MLASGTKGDRMRREIASQPEVLSGAIASYEAKANAICSHIERPEMVLLAARGSSDNAALYARYLIEVHLGIPVALAAPSVITRYASKLRYPRTLAIGISQSGAAPDVSEVIETMRELGHETLAITNVADSRLSNAAAHTIELGVGEETAVAATKTFTASMAALYEIVRAIGAPLDALKLPTNDWVAQTSALAHEATGPIVRLSPTFALARGFSFSIAHETALKLIECALIPTKAYSTADFQHGPKALAGAGSAAVDFDGEAEWLDEQGCERIVPPVPEGVPPEALPIWQVIFGQWLAYHAALARGLNPDSPRHLKKVTETL